MTGPDSSAPLKIMAQKCLPRKVLYSEAASLTEKVEDWWMMQSKHSAPLLTRKASRKTNLEVAPKGNPQDESFSLLVSNAAKQP